MSESGSFFGAIQDKNEAIRKRNEAFEEVYSGPTKNDFSIRVDDSRGIAFEATQGMTREEFQEKNRQAVDKLFEEPEEIGSVFEKQDKINEQPRFSEKPNKGLGNINWNDFYDESDTVDPKQPHFSKQAIKPEDFKIYYHDTKDTVTEVKGLDLDAIKNKVEKEEIKKDKEMKHDDMGMSGPFTTSSMKFL